MIPLQIGCPVLRRILHSSAVLLALTAAARAQDPALPPAHVASVDGTATLERDGHEQLAAMNMPFIPGDRLRTGDGRVEVLFPDGTALDADSYSTIELQSPTLMRLTAGRVILVVAGASDPAAAIRYQIDTPVAWARTDGPGEYRVATLSGRDGPQTEVAVFRGSCALATERGSILVRAGERSVAPNNEAPSFPHAFNSARFDAFDRWSAARRAARTGAISSQYLPQDLQMYGATFDRYGSWQYAAPYGYVWYPTVAPDWRPYYYGYWAPYQPWGWTWIGFDFWAWPTHHFGRWGFVGSRWFWVPSRTWGPAWVSWAAAPGFVSWCPLGFDERPVFGFSLAFASRWAGWTVVPQTSFGFARVDRFAVAPHHIPASTEFVVQRTAPVAVPRAVVAGRVTIAAAGAGVAVPRSSTVGVWPHGDQRVQAGVGARHTRAISRAPASAPAVANGRSAATAPPGAHEFKQPLPDNFRSPGYAVTRQPASAAPSTTDAPIPGRANPVTPRTTAPASRAVPRGKSPSGVPAPRGYQTSSTPDAPTPHSGAYSVTPRSDAPPHAVPRGSPPASAAPAPRASPAPYQAPPAQFKQQGGPPARMPSMEAPRSAPAPRAIPRSSGSMPHAGASPSSGSPSGGAHSGGPASGGSGEGRRR